MYKRHKQRSESSNDILDSMKSSAFPKGVLNRRFGRRFAYFAAEGKVGRAAARNLSFAINAAFAKGYFAPRRIPASDKKTAQPDGPMSGR